MDIDYTIDNTFIFSFVRMNPPTPGHLELVKTMIYKGIDLGINKGYIMTSSSLDGKNPLPCSSETIPKPKKNAKEAEILMRISQPDLIYKSYVLEKMIHSYKKELVELEPDNSKKILIENFNIFVLCSIGSPFSFIYNVIKKKYIDLGISKINMIFIVGRDRADFFDAIVDTFRYKDYIQSVDGIILEREGMSQAKTTDVSELNIQNITPSEYSGTLVRNLVRAGDRTKFEQIYSRYLDTEDIHKLYETIQIGMQLPVVKKASEDENPYSRYFDGRLLPVVNHSIYKQSKRQKRELIGGSKKTRKRKTKGNKRKNLFKNRRTSKKLYK